MVGYVVGIVQYIVQDFLTERHDLLGRRPAVYSLIRSEHVLADVIASDRHRHPLNQPRPDRMGDLDFLSQHILEVGFHRPEMAPHVSDRVLYHAIGR